MFTHGLAKPVEPKQTYNVQLQPRFNLTRFLSRFPTYGNNECYTRLGSQQPPRSRST